MDEEDDFANLGNFLKKAKIIFENEPFNLIKMVRIFLEVKKASEDDQENVLSDDYYIRKDAARKMA